MKSLVGLNMGQELSSPAAGTTTSRPENVSPEALIQPIDAWVALRPLAFGPIANTVCAPSGAQSGIVASCLLSGMTPLLAPMGAPVSPSRNTSSPFLELMMRVVSGLKVAHEFAID